MKTTLMVKLQPTVEQRSALLETMEQFNAACNAIAEVAYRERTANKVHLQKLVYYDIRDRFTLSAQLTIRAIAKVVEAYKRDKTKQPTFRPHGAIVYDQRILSWKSVDRVSLLTLHGREIIPVVMGSYQAARLDRVRGQADLIYHNGEFYLAATVDMPAPPEAESTDVLGIDLGITNLATDSDGEQYSGEQVDKTRRHYERLRRGLQRVGTTASRRKLKRISGRECRFKRNTNHIISKRLVAKAYDTTRAIALEELTGLRERATVRKAQRSQHSKWAFAELRAFMTYKARLAGVPLHMVDPRNTSCTCLTCGCIDKRNRPDQATFQCISCGTVAHADINAARTIRARALVMVPMVSADTCLSQGQAAAL
jgi:putative transposase